MEKKAEDREAGARKVAVIDDDRLSSHNLAVKLRFVGEEHVILPSAAWRAWFSQGGKRAPPYCVLVGNLAGTTAQALLGELHALDPGLPVILTGEPAQLEALEPAQREQVIAVYRRPLHYEQLRGSLNEARLKRGLTPNTYKSVLISETGTAMFRSLVGESACVQRVREQIQQVARGKVTVLVVGESGTGKEIVARNLHYSSGRGQAPFVAVNAGALGAESLDPAFYRMERGEKPPADSPPGWFAKARGGTLFLDMVDEMPADAQAFLLRCLEQRGRDDGGSGGEAPEARLVVAARTDLEEKVQRGQFREDLFYRLNIFPIEVPPLRDRVEDIPELLNELAARLEHRNGVAVRFNSAACRSLQRHSWPGNVRELANLVERLSIMRPSEVIGLSDLPASYQHGGEEAEAETAGLGSAPAAAAPEAEEGGNPLEAPKLLEGLSVEGLKRCLGSFEKQLLQVALEDCGWNIEDTADHLQTSPAQLDQLMKKHGLHREGKAPV